MTAERIGYAILAAVIVWFGWGILTATVDQVLEVLARVLA